MTRSDPDRDRFFVGPARSSRSTSNSSGAALRSDGWREQHAAAAAAAGWFLLVATAARRSRSRSSPSPPGWRAGRHGARRGGRTRGSCGVDRRTRRPARGPGRPAAMAVVAAIVVVLVRLVVERASGGQSSAFIEICAAASRHDQRPDAVLAGASSRSSSPSSASPFAGQRCVA